MASQPIIKPDHPPIELGDHTHLGTPDDYANLVQAIVTNEMLEGDVIRLGGAIRLAPR